MSQDDKTIQFIEKARKIHGDRYNYSKVKYVNSNTKVCIICPKHGEFLKSPENHIHKTKPQGCPHCSLENQHTKTISIRKKLFILRSKLIHQGKYDYSKVKYVNNSTKVCIICPEHGEFWQSPNSHAQGKGCPICRYIASSSKTRSTLYKFIEKAKQVHSDKYDYSKVEYINNRTKVCIICPEHGEFWQSPDTHLRGSGCPKCVGKSLTTEDWIKLAKTIHNDKYDYSRVEYRRCFDRLNIICPIHGEFTQVSHDHLSGNGCPQCAKESTKNKLRKPIQKFITEANEIHNKKYDYSKVEYKNTETKICIICPKHGEFWQTPACHLDGYGCPVCKESHLEREMRNFLLENNIDFEYQKKFDWLGKQSLDFYIPQYNIAIECQGKQHFGLGGWSNKFDFQKLQELDLRKYNLCKEHNIKLLYYTHEDFEEFLGESLVKNKDELIERIKEC